MYDIKLKDGRYFSNIDVVDEFTGDVNNIKDILNNSHYMFLYYMNNDKEEDLLARIYSDDIEYVCEAYEYERED